MTSSLLVSVFCFSLLSTSVLCQFDGDMLNRAQFAVGLGKRSIDETFSRAQIPMGFGKRSAGGPESSDDMPLGRYARFYPVGSRGEESVRLPSGSRLFLLH